jgi:hypothetical protein
VKISVSSYYSYFAVFLLPNVMTNIYSFQTVPCSNKLNGFTLCNEEHHLQKGFMGIPSQNKLEETGHRFCVMIFKNVTRFSSFS